MDINTSNDNDVCIVELDGKFDTASAAPAEASITKLLDDGVSQMLIDFAKVPYIASSGLRVLLKVAQRLTQEGGKLHVCCLNETVSEVFEISGFDKILAVYESNQDAKEAF